VGGGRGRSTKSMNNTQHHCELRVWAAPLRFHVIMTQPGATDMQYAQREKSGQYNKIFQGNENST